MSKEVAVPLRDVVPTEAITDGGEWGPLASGAQAVVRPSTVEEVASVLKWAGGSAVRVVPLGTGRHAADVVPNGDYILLSVDRMADVQIYEAADLTVTVGAGLLVSGLLDATRPHDQWLPFDPPDFPERSLGGLVAAGVTGPLWAGYGELKNHVLGANVVCGDGRVLRLGGRVVKNVAGFDLLRAVVGSRGRLGVITSVTLRLFPVPATDRLLLFRRDRMSDLATAARAVATAPVLPASIVITNALDGPTLLVRLHGAQTTVDADQRSLEAATGERFDVVEGDGAREMAAQVRDAGTDLANTVTLFGMPADLGDLLLRVEDVPGVTVVADGYRGSVNARADASLDALRRAEPLSATVRALNDGVRRVFDPDDVLWTGKA